MDVPDVLAMDLPAALACCAAAGWMVEIRETAPPGGKPSGKPRVVRFEITGSRCGVLTVAREMGKEV
ncbi:hypothetical protein [Desulfotomaculum copahuensis]|uniref:PASTA domain-containing protein n=1 Tax=Desulfotomaculum copahuensis TaxID=1838280 RepID=A0A1B7LHT8_9FIRM|nr:hypothetical protein [Desulfotomaculum copahuensis]OAT85855.1 hypothetical protein A6M21_05100 [Desulfotomaculum copahuensis]